MTVSHPGIASSTKPEANDSRIPEIFGMVRAIDLAAAVAGHVAGRQAGSRCSQRWLG